MHILFYKKKYIWQCYLSGPIFIGFPDLVLNQPDPDPGDQLIDRIRADLEHFYLHANFMSVYCSFIVVDLGMFFVFCHFFAIVAVLGLMLMTFSRLLEVERENERLQTELDKSLQEVDIRIIFVINTYYLFYMDFFTVLTRVAPDTDLAGYPANNFSG